MGGYYAPMLKNFHMEIMISTDILKKNTVMLSPICIVYKNNEDDEEYKYELKRCAIFKKCFNSPKPITFLLNDKYKTLSPPQITKIQKIFSNDALKVLKI